MSCFVRIQTHTSNGGGGKFGETVNVENSVQNVNIFFLKKWKNGGWLLNQSQFGNRSREFRIPRRNLNKENFRSITEMNSYSD